MKLIDRLLTSRDHLVIDALQANLPLVVNFVNVSVAPDTAEIFTYFTLMLLTSKIFCNSRTGLCNAVQQFGSLEAP